MLNFFLLTQNEKTGDPIKNATEFMNNHHYQFDLWFDLKNQNYKTDKNEGLLAFFKPTELDGIPLKIVIDADGYIRYKYLGYSPSISIEKTMPIELSAIIDQVKRSPTNNKLQKFLGL